MNGPALDVLTSDSTKITVKYVIVRLEILSKKKRIAAY